MSHISPHDTPPFDPDADDHLDPAHDDSTEVEQVVCWRCDKSYDATSPRCAVCLAANDSWSGPTDPRDNSDSRLRSPAIVRVVWGFVAMAAFSLLGAFGIALTVDLTPPIKDSSALLLLGWIGVIEAIDVLVVIIAYTMIRFAPIRFADSSTRVRAWCLSVPLLALTLAINFTYHSFLRDMLNIDQVTDPLAACTSFWPWLVIVVCLQPAIVEEIFFRQVALGAALEMVSPVQAILMTSLLFSLAHLGQPFSLPILALIGVVLGYLRLASGSLWLPMLFHFLHNLAVLIWNGSP